MGKKGAAIMFCVKLKKTNTETFEMLKVRTVKNVYRDQVFFNDIKCPKKGESLYKKMNGKAVLQLPHQKNRRKPIKSVWHKLEI
jgi:hypothetical protein